MLFYLYMECFSENFVDKCFFNNVKEYANEGY